MGNATTKHKSNPPPESPMASPVKLYRKLKGLTQYTLAARLGCTQQMVHYWEQGRNIPGKAFNDALAAAFEKDPADLLREIMEYAEYVGRNPPPAKR